MPEITAAMVKELRERTGAGMMDCKNALNETGGNFEEAVVFLRKKLGSKADTRAGRAAGEGVIAVHVQASDTGQIGVILELNSETDFVARSDDFRALARELAEQIAQTGPATVEEALAQSSLAHPGVTLKDRVTDAFTKLRENLVFKRFERVATGPNGTVAAYIHVPANNKIGVLVELEAGSAEAAQSEALSALGKELAMQIAASRPTYLHREEVPESVLETERDIARTQAINENRPEAAMAKIVEGRVNKFYEQSVLMEQVYLRDTKKTVRQVIAEAGAGVSLKRFIRLEVGEKTAGESTSEE